MPKANRAEQKQNAEHIRIIGAGVKSISASLEKLHTNFARDYRGASTERADVVAYLRAYEHDGVSASELADNIESGQHSGCSADEQESQAHYEALAKKHGFST